MKIDRARAQQAFADYAAHYNAADAKVKLKIDHTYRVAALCARIAQSLALPPEDVGISPPDPAPYAHRLACTAAEQVLRGLTMEQKDIKVLLLHRQSP